mmetsp:Transcript_4190/g.9170  ORF Transcript_4190/g.9170 Transcript_4190/m.9170 type:complete len:199 (-) Transcript_4190:114-710(-)
MFWLPSACAALLLAHGRPLSQPRPALSWRTCRFLLCEGDPIDVNAEDATYEACIKMRVKELKAELELRKVDTAGVMEKEELARLLADARASGKADASMIDDFNKQVLEKDLKGEPSNIDLDADDLKEAVASDGGLPGGMTPEALMGMMNNPEMMTLLRNPKMQEVMKLVMEKGPEAAKEQLQDPEMQEMLQKVKKLTG